MWIRRHGCRRRSRRSRYGSRRIASRSGGSNRGMSGGTAIFLSFKVVAHHQSEVPYESSLSFFFSNIRRASTMNLALSSSTAFFVGSLASFGRVSKAFLVLFIFVFVFCGVTFSFLKNWDCLYSPLLFHYRGTDQERAQDPVGRKNS